VKQKFVSNSPIFNLLQREHSYQALTPPAYYWTMPRFDLPVAVETWQVKRPDPSYIWNSKRNSDDVPALK
jgi:hypothetical protein